MISPLRQYQRVLQALLYRILLHLKFATVSMNQTCFLFLKNYGEVFVKMEVYLDIWDTSLVPVLIWDGYALAVEGVQDVVDADNVDSDIDSDSDYDYGYYDYDCDGGCGYDYDCSEYYCCDVGYDGE